MLGEGLPLALQNRFVSKDSLTVRFLVEERICGGSIQDNIDSAHVGKVRNYENEILAGVK